MSTEKLSELSKPVMYSLRFRNMHTGEPDKNINANTTFSTLEKAKAYGLGSRYVTQDDGKIVSVRDPSQDPIVEPLYSQEYVSALLAELEAKDKRILELDYLRLSACEVFKEIGNELGCNPDNESIMMAIDDLKKDNTSLRDQRAGLAREANELEAQAKVWESAATKHLERAEAAEKRLATPVRLVAYRNSPDMHTKQYYEAIGFNQGIDACSVALRAAGFTVEGDE